VVKRERSKNNTCNDNNKAINEEYVFEKLDINNSIKTKSNK
jgi:hypothetical protein